MVRLGMQSALCRATWRRRTDSSGSVGRLASCCQAHIHSAASKGPACHPQTRISSVPGGKPPTERLCPQASRPCPQTWLGPMPVEQMPRFKWRCLLSPATLTNAGFSERPRWRLSRMHWAIGLWCDPGAISSRRSSARCWNTPTGEVTGGSTLESDHPTGAPQFRIDGGPRHFARVDQRTRHLITTRWPRSPSSSTRSARQ